MWLTNPKTYLCGYVTLIFFIVVIFSPFVMVGGGHHHDLARTNDCPFMVGGIGLCDMTLLDHIVSWQRIFTVLPTELFILAFLLLAALIYQYFKPLGSPPRLHLLSLRRLKTLLLFQFFIGSTISPRAP